MKGITYVATLALLLTIGSAAKANICTDIQVHGGDGNGIVDNSTPLNNALAALGTYGGCISFPAGNYYFSSNVSYSLGPNQTVQLVGSGPQATTLNGQGIELTGANNANNSVLISNMTISTSSSGTGNAILLQPIAGQVWWPTQEVLIEDVVISASGSGSWQTGLQMQGLSNAHVNRTHFLNTVTGTYIWSESTPIADFDITNCLFGSTLGSSTGLSFGNNIASVNILDNYFTGPSTGVFHNGTTSANINIASNEFSDSTAAINMPYTQHLSIVGNNFGGASSNSNMINLSQVTDFVVSGNQFLGSSVAGQIGLYVSSSTYGTVVSNLFSQLGTGIDLSTGAQYIDVQSNVYANVTTQVVPGSLNTIGGGHNFDLD